MLSKDDSVRLRLAVGDDVRATLKQIYEKGDAHADETAAPPSMATFRARQSAHSIEKEENIYGVGSRDSHP